MNLYSTVFNNHYSTVIWLLVTHMWSLMVSIIKKILKYGRYGSNKRKIDHQSNCYPNVICYSTVIDFRVMKNYDESGIRKDCLISSEILF